MDRSRALAHCHDHVLGRRILHIEIGIGTHLTFSFEDTDVKLWMYMSAWNISSSDGMVLACEDDRTTFPEKLGTLVGLTITLFEADRCNNLTLGLGNEVILRALATFSDEDAWMLLESGAWFLGAGPNGQFVMEIG
ncbi:hypothetical protein IEQ44_06065 [Nocardioides sp. Y6]|uniref:Uncharacterized protein n=1 Tax=Nocardioides malaquae TaxID=2773426 RepID=A0ABR9RSR6_9ACTN|nr:hypothetical protein [Nocardioides malaquae]MBE7324212.1 hypothetical protein [Nocardioides malaquae]